MKKYICIMLCAVIVFGMSFTVCAASQKNTADALNSLGLFLGMGPDKNGDPIYGLEQSLTREQGVMLLLRMLGLEKDAQNYNGTHPFTDVTNPYYDPYIAYAYSTGLVKGTGAHTFDGATAMSEKMFATFCMRPLGYQDGADADFLYDDAVAFARNKGVSRNSVGDFTRGDAVTMFWQLLNTKCKNSAKTLADTLIEKGVFTAEAFAKANNIRENGKDAVTTSSTDSASVDADFELPTEEWSAEGDVGGDTADGNTSDVGTSEGDTSAENTSGADNTDAADIADDIADAGTSTESGAFELPEDVW